MKENYEANIWDGVDIEDFQAVQAEMERISDEAKTNHQKFDHVFRILFNDKVKLLSLYNAISGKDYDNPDDLLINTLEDAVFIGMKNDISFILASYINLFEHQSTINKNIPLRGFYYFADLYKTMYYGEMLHKSMRIEIETPQFIVFYSGDEDVPDRREMRLSESFKVKAEEPDVEVVAHIININKGHNVELASKCKPLEEYSEFVRRMRKATRGVAKEELAVTSYKVITECIEDEILAEILKKERARVMSSVLGEFNFQKYVAIERSDSFDAGKEVGIEEGIEQGIKQGRVYTLFGFLKNGGTHEDAKRMLEASEEELKKAEELLLQYQTQSE